MKTETGNQPGNFTEMWPGSSKSFPWNELLAAIPSTIFLVTGFKKNGKPNASLQSWSTFFADSGEFLCLMGSVRKTTHLYQSLIKTKECVLNFPNAEIYDKCYSTIDHNGFDEDEITASGLTIESAKKVNAPRILECFLNMECEYFWEKENFESSPHVTVCLHVKHIAMDPEYSDETKLGRYGKSGYIYNIHQPYSPETGEKYGTWLGAIKKHSKQ